MSFCSITRAIQINLYKCHFTSARKVKKTNPKKKQNSSNIELFLTLTSSPKQINYYSKHYQHTVWHLCYILKIDKNYTCKLKLFGCPYPSWLHRSKSESKETVLWLVRGYSRNPIQLPIHLEMKTSKYISQIINVQEKCWSRMSRCGTFQLCPIAAEIVPAFLAVKTEVWKFWFKIQRGLYTNGGYTKTGQL